MILHAFACIARRWPRDGAALLAQPARLEGALSRALSTKIGKRIAIMIETSMQREKGADSRVVPSTALVARYRKPIGGGESGRRERATIG